MSSRTGDVPGSLSLLIEVFLGLLTDLLVAEIPDSWLFLRLLSAAGKSSSVTDVADLESRSAEIS
jgi:hypothetical protein